MRASVLFYAACSIKSEDGISSKHGPHWSGSDSGDWDDDNDDDHDCDDGDGHDEDRQDDGDDDDGASGNNLCVYEGGIAKDGPGKYNHWGGGSVVYGDGVYVDDVEGADGNDNDNDGDVSDDNLFDRERGRATERS